MPAFGPDALFTDRLNDQQIADVSNYVLSRYGDDALSVTAADVALVREGGPKAPLAVMAKFTIPAIVVACILIAFAVIVLVRRRRREV
jgi:fructose 5-dehydrogenase cytochrome subunit